MTLPVFIGGLPLIMFLQRFLRFLFCQVFLLLCFCYVGQAANRITPGKLLVCNVWVCNVVCLLVHRASATSLSYQIIKITKASSASGLLVRTLSQKTSSLTKIEYVDDFVGAGWATPANVALTLAFATSARVVTSVNVVYYITLHICVRRWEVCVRLSLFLL